ncbi:hypothetical protein IFT57_05410 [Pseudomonas sp. CFBP 13719]|nr:hypothetical protein [Pseudomonas sp. CFBP 13719]
MSTTMSSFDVPAGHGEFILHLADAAVLREALILNEASATGSHLEDARSGFGAILSTLDDACVRMLALETVAINNAPGSKTRSGLKIDRDGHYLLTDKSITYNKSLDHSGQERGI